MTTQSLLSRKEGANLEQKKSIFLLKRYPLAKEKVVKYFYRLAVLSEKAKDPNVFAAASSAYYFDDGQNPKICKLVDRIYDGSLTTYISTLFQDSYAICIQDYNLNPKSLSTICGHRFHEECLTEWLQVKLICPLCNHSIFGQLNNSTHLHQAQELLISSHFADISLHSSIKMQY